MNLAFTTILVLVALFPGFFVQSGYHSGSFSKKYSRSSVFNNAAIAVLPSLVYHAFAINLINWLAIGPRVSFEAIGKLIFGQSNVDLAKVFTQSVGNHTGLIVTYIFISVIIGASSGYAAAYVIRKKGLDLKYPRLRFDNTWYYLISGESLGWPDKKPDETMRKGKLSALREGKVDVRVEILVTIDDSAFIYEGRAKRYFLNKDGLDRIHLDDCTRKPFPVTYEEFLNQKSNDDSQEKIYLANDFVIFRDSIININFNYPGLSDIIKNLKDLQNLPEASDAIIVGIDGSDESFDTQHDDGKADAKA